MPEPNQLRGVELEVALGRHHLATRHAYQLLTREGGDGNKAPRIACPICFLSKADYGMVEACMDGHRRDGDARLQAFHDGQYDTPEAEMARGLSQNVHESYRASLAPPEEEARG